MKKYIFTLILALSCIYVTSTTTAINGIDTKKYCHLKKSFTILNTTPNNISIKIFTRDHDLGLNISEAFVLESQKRVYFTQPTQDELRAGAYMETIRGQTILVPLIPLKEDPQSTSTDISIFILLHLPSGKTHLVDANTLSERQIILIQDLDK